MQPDPQWLDPLARRAAELSQAPSQAAGEDATGCVRVAIGRDGSPERIEVRAGWSHRLAAEELAGAVLQANAAAVRHAIQQWKHQVHAAPDAPMGTSVPPHGRIRDGSELAERILEVLQAVGQPVNQTRQAGVEPYGRHVVIRLGPGGLSGCVIDARWASGRDAGTITAALAQALSAARTAQQQRVGQSSAVTDALLGDALTTLQAMTGESTNDCGE